MKKLRYVFPETKNFREQRPDICWWQMYGWIEGYGVLFDPVLQSIIAVIPEWENGYAGNFRAGDFIITSCAQASEKFKDIAHPGLYIRPRNGIEIREFSRKSEKEKISTPLGDYYYPFGFIFDRYQNASTSWKIGGSPAIKKSNESLAVCFELFAMFGHFRHEIPERCFTDCADIVARLFEELGFKRRPDRLEQWQSDTRVDFQAYGLNRLFVQWFLEINGAAKEMVREADDFYSKAVSAWGAGDPRKVAEFLGEAFGGLAKLRKSFSQMDVLFLECPHLGILFADKGFFELEWPEQSKRMIFSYFNQIEKHAYKVSLEAGASCWKNLAARYPELGVKLKELWEKGALELTNGTFSLPYALLSPLAFQYWQFKKGHDAFKKVFGKAPETYQCQENSLTPQMPELLKHFGYKKAFHVTQNHGEAPPEKSEFIKWVSPAGHGLAAMSAQNPLLTRKGNNYFLDLPLIHHEYGRENRSLNYINFQDLGYVPFRLQMIRAHKYAPVWGRFALAGAAFGKITEKTLEPKSYPADAYKISANIFYSDETNINALSHYERFYALVGLRRQLLLAAQAAGKISELYEPINESIENLCLLEAHDCGVVQGQRRGEFHSTNTMETPPYSRETLSRKISEIAAEITSNFDKNVQKISGEGAGELYNAAEVALGFARVKYPALFSGKGTVCHGNAVYAAGPFGAFSAARPTVAGELTNAGNCNWEVRAEGSTVAIGYKSNKILFAPVDRKRGRFELFKSELKKDGVLNFAQFFWISQNPHLQLVLTSVVFADGCDYVEIDVQYSPRNDFDVVSKWDDYLALEFSAGAGLKNVFRFNPNVSSLTSENRVASPYCLVVETAAGNAASFMNEGAVLYELDRENGKINWVFHVACETVRERRMALAFGKKDPFRLSRAWGQGVLPLNALNNQFLTEQNWDGLSVEDLIEPDTVLVSNLKDTDVECPLINIVSAENMAGEKVLNNSKIKLKPFELALIKLVRW